MTVPVTIRIQEADFNLAAETSAMTKDRTDIGAVVSFTGLCRGFEGDDTVTALTLEHYPGMAEEEIQRHADEAVERWPITALTIIHRVGRLVPGDNIVLVLAASAHRQAAFAAAEFLMDYLKANAPFWKREERSGESRWVEAHSRDDAAMARWSKD
uniref:Molybdopterin synthase catalytic subunit n=1 Tax=Rhodopseudomonas palustris (strain DX-1) TaxID=652103 RepID=E6VGC5_RHOPX